MKILNPENSSIESLLGNVVVAILKLNPEVKNIAFNNLKSGFSLDSIEGEFKHEVRQFEKSYDNQQAEQISLMV